MPDFRAYMLDKEGRIMARADIAAANFEDAKGHAFQIVSANTAQIYGLEIWMDEERLFPTGPTPAVDQGEDLLVE